MQSLPFPWAALAQFWTYATWLATAANPVTKNRLPGRRAQHAKA